MAHSTGNTAVDGVLVTYLNKKFVSDLDYSLQHQKFTMRGDLPENQGNVIRFNDFAPPGSGVAGANVSYSGAGTTSLTEGTHTEHQITGITIGEVDCTMAEYGEWVQINKLYDLTVKSGTRDRIEKRLRDGGLVSIDSKVREWATESTNILYCTTAQTGGQTTQTSVTACSAAAIIKAGNMLFGGLAKGLSGVPGHPNDHFAAVITHGQELEIVTEVTTLRVTWSQAVVNVPGAEGLGKWINGYVGSIYGTAVYKTQNYATTGALTTTSAHIGFVYGDGGVGAASLEQMNPKIIINDINSPFKNKNSVAWHLMMGGKLLRSAAVVKMYSTGT